MYKTYQSTEKVQSDAESDKGAEEKKENIISRIMHWEFFKASHISDKHSKLDIIYLKFYVSY